MTTYPKGSVMVVHIDELVNQEAMRAIYHSYLRPMPAIEGVVWYYPNVNMVIIDESHMVLEAPHFHGFDIGKAPAIPFIEYVPTKTAKRIPRQPKPRPRDQYSNRRRF